MEKKLIFFELLVLVFLSYQLNAMEVGVAPALKRPEVQLNKLYETAYQNLDKRYSLIRDYYKEPVTIRLDHQIQKIEKSLSTIGQQLLKFQGTKQCRELADDLIEDQDYYLTVSQEYHFTYQKGQIVATTENFLARQRNKIEQGLATFKKQCKNASSSIVG